MLLNLNADLGESFGPWSMGDDQNLLPVVDSANIACGFHAGDPLVMTQSVQQAKSCKVSIGAHPGFPDLQGFGRRPMTLPHAEVTSMLHYQLAALAGMAACQNWEMTHVKPHGALNNMACEDEALARTIAEAVYAFNPRLIFLAPVLSELARAGSEIGLNVALEVFADRAYTNKGSLVSRRLPGAVLETAEQCIGHVQSMIESRGVVSVEGYVLETEFHSICVHGDNAHSVETAGKVRQALLKDGHRLLPLSELMKQL